MKSAFLVISIAALLVGCSTNALVTKSWHTSPDRDPRMSTIYPYVDWSVVQKLAPGMLASEAKSLIHDLQSYHHPVNAIVFSTYQGRSYEVALKLSKDEMMIEDISYKIVERNAEQGGAADADNSSR